MGNDLPHKEETINHINFLPEFNFLQQEEKKPGVKKNHFTFRKVLTITNHFTFST